MKNYLYRFQQKKYSGQFAVRVPSKVHQKLALEAAERGVSMSRLVSAKLAM
ncbi:MULTISPECIES: toxin-antitoxin system HicB family antitoxin [Acinetobacter]|uniref:toxin-antitoxin system HicB family antitoxin n=1 Tax=Acinetobacter TaxID=469 RepID=UPI001E4032FE|nr:MULTISPECIES: toxin-antitoxin system HicB family antitoxin [Acinetobacter]